MTTTNATATIAEVIAEISARLDALEAAIEELTGKKIAHEAEGKEEEPQESAEAQAPEWDSFESLEAEAAEIYGHLAEWREAFCVHNAQGKVRYARDAIYSLRVIASIFERRFASATCIERDDAREDVLAKLHDLAIALDKINCNLNALIDEGKGDEALNKCRGPHRNNVTSAFSGMNGALQLGWEVYMPFKYRWLKKAAA